MKKALVILFLTFAGICATIARVADNTHHGAHDAQLLEQGVDLVMPGIQERERHSFEGEIDLIKRFYKLQPRELDLDLLPRDISVDIVERQLGQLISSGVKFLVKGIKAIVDKIKNEIRQDKIARGEFTKHLVERMHSQYPTFNFVVCHVKHEAHWDGKQGQDWGHYHEEFDIKLGGTVGYEIYWGKAGKFTRKGDGGFINWAYNGNVKSRSKDGKTIVFGPP
ncbi:hypothetical protein AX17_004876 [Amanita inopinata Kibby_2008]|nr:hypothetical protein AX17_004876 [Amanita inopinata Kibby_2008]